MRRVDVLIVGGGPAGASCARRLREAGAECLILDKRRFPRSKPCAGWITPGVVRQVGLDPAAYPGRLTTYAGLRISVRGLPFWLPLPQHAIRRLEFDSWMLDRAGVPILRHTVKAIRREGGAYVVDGAFSARFLVGAGGTRCPVGRTLFHESSPRAPESLIVTLEAEFAHPHRDPRCRLWFLENGLHGYGWYVPKAGGIVNVGIGGKAQALRARGDRLRRHWHLLLDKLERLGLLSGETPRPRGYAYYLRQPRPQVRRDNALIAGDAVGLATLDMGEGIGPAVCSGVLAAEAILADRDCDLSAIARVSFLPRLRRLAPEGPGRGPRDG